ncbi:MAG: amidase family protein, partial [Alkalibacterium gilvum]
MSKYAMKNLEKLSVSTVAPYDPLQAFVRDNHIAMKGLKSGQLSDYVFAAKDVFKVKGSTWGNGHPDWLRFSEPDEFTASAITKLLDQGSDLVGKTICDELCYSISGENWHYGSPLNPNDTRRLTG